MRKNQSGVDWVVVVVVVSVEEELFARPGESRGLLRHHPLQVDYLFTRRLTEPARLEGEEAGERGDSASSVEAERAEQRYMHGAISGIRLAVVDLLAGSQLPGLVYQV